MNKQWIKYCLLIVLLSVLRNSAFAQAQYVADPIERNWYNEEQTAKIQVYKGMDGKYYGKIIWLKVPMIDGKAKVDIHNPNEERRNDPLMGLLILKKFKKAGANTYEDGTIYDPKNGKTYDCKITMEGDKLNVRGYIGISLLGRTTVWTKAD